MGFSIIIPLSMPPILPVDTGVIDLIHPAVVYRMRTVHLSGDDRLAEGAINTSSYSLFSYQHVILSPESVDHHCFANLRFTRMLIYRPVLTTEPIDHHVIKVVRALP